MPQLKTREDPIAVKVSGVSKDFVLPHERTQSIKSSFVNLFKNKQYSNNIQHTLEDINFEVKQGEFFGIVGRNGSGKSTLLKILAGIYQPTKGFTKTQGKLVPFIELGVGFNPELSGRENIYLNGALLGFSKKEVDERYDEIVAFAELERFMDQKLKNYSSGMQVRLAFSVAIKANADILLVDEVLAVGDDAFKRKCFEYFWLLKKNNKTVVFVTHDMSAIREYCDRAMLIEKAKVIDINTPNMIASQYTKLFNKKTSEQDDANIKVQRWGDNSMKITTITVIPNLLVENEQELTISLEVIVHKSMHDPVFGFLIKNQGGQSLLGTNSKIKQQSYGEVRAGEKLHIEWQVPNIFSDGRYFVDVAAQHRDEVTVADWWEEASSFEVFNEEKVHYPINPPIKLSLKKNKNG